MSGAFKAREVAIVGIGFSEVKRRSDKTLGQLAVSACTRALEDAGLTAADIDGISNYPSPSRPADSPVDGKDIVGVHYLAQALRLKDLSWMCSVSGGTITASIVQAVNALAAGACTYALVWRGMHNPAVAGGFGRVEQARVSGDEQFLAPWGFRHVVIDYAMPYSRYMAKYGATREHMATFAVRNRANAAQNPNAVFYQQPITRDEYLNTRMIAEPLSMLDCDMPVDGCGAVVLTTADRARDLKQKPVFVQGAVALGLNPRHPFSLEYEDFKTSAASVAKALWASARMDHSDITHAQLYDGFVYHPCFWLEAFGFYPEGQAYLGLQDDTTSQHGSLPLNTGGGALGMGRLHGSPQVIEAVLQIQRRAGPRQIANPQVALVETGDPLRMCAAMVLTE